MLESILFNLFVNYLKMVVVVFCINTTSADAKSFRLIQNNCNYKITEVSVNIESLKHKMPHQIKC